MSCTQGGVQQYRDAGGVACSCLGDQAHAIMGVVVLLQHLEAVA